MNEFVEALKDFDKFKDSVVGYNYDIENKCHAAVNDACDSGYSPEKVKEAETLMDKAIEQINQFKQKLNSNNQSNK